MHGRRSRNAVVALKLLPARWRPCVEVERSRNAVVALKLRHPPPGHPVGKPKQERRGGIETEDRRLLLDLPDHEAGTPWWY